jgi:hypothetical protein
LWQLKLKFSDWQKYYSRIQKLEEWKRREGKKTQALGLVGCDAKAAPDCQRFQMIISETLITLPKPTFSKNPQTC